jgi:valyl-tRNA synthetase
MSKSKGNVIDPLELIDEYGADALRFTLAIMAAQGRDVKLDPSRIAGYRNFGTKLWNATRFADMNGAALAPNFDPASVKLTINRWIVTELTRTAAEVKTAIEGYKFNEASGALYRFVWHQVCDWYLELLKPVFMGEDEAAKAESRACAAHVLAAAVKLLHPFMPFMTEELWTHLAGEGAGLACHAAWPEPEFEDNAAAAEINWLIDLVSGLRSVRAEMNVPPSAKAPLVMVGTNAETGERLVRHEPAIMRLARVSDILLETAAPRGSAQIVVGEATACLPLGDLIDLDAEKARLQKALGKVADDIDKIERKLSNDKFVANAKPEIVAAEREKLADLIGQRDKLSMAIERLGQTG